MKGKDMNKIVPIEPTKHIIEALTVSGSCKYPEQAWRNAIKAAPESGHIIVSKVEYHKLKADSERWKHFASNQAALMLGSDLDPSDHSIDWLEECNKLADKLMKG
jgi:hypothetical protein